MDLAALEERLGHRFSRPELLRQALTHPSHGADHYQRLEFLGDALLGLVVAQELCRRFPDLPVGALHRMRVGLVNQEALHARAETSCTDATCVGRGIAVAALKARPSPISL